MIRIQRVLPSFLVLGLISCTPNTTSPSPKTVPEIFVTAKSWAYTTYGETHYTKELFTQQTAIVPTCTVEEPSEFLEGATFMVERCDYDGVTVVFILDGGQSYFSDVLW